MKLTFLLYKTRGCCGVRNYESHIQGDKPVVIGFFTRWSQPWQLMIPIFQELKEILGERATILEIDIENEPQLAESYQVQTIPTLIIFHKGQVLWRKNGISTLHEILENLQILIA
jgi:thioredoxin 1